MKIIVVLFCVLPVYCNCIAYVDRVESDCNPKLVNLSINFTHNAKGESVTNVTITNYVTATKILIYITFRVSENENDREYKRKLINTVVDYEKATRGLQSNIMVKGYVNSILKCIDFELKMPFLPVSEEN